MGNCVSVVNTVVEKMSQSKNDVIDSMLNEWTKTLPDSLNEKMINSVAQSHWYSFYDNAFDRLLTSNWYIVSMIVTVFVAIAGLNFWRNHQNIKTILRDSQKKFEEKINLSITREMEDRSYMQKVLEHKIDFLNNLMKWKTSEKKCSDCISMVESTCDLAESIMDVKKEIVDYCFYIQDDFDQVYKIINQLDANEKKKFLQHSLVMKNIIEKKIGDLQAALSFTEFWAYIHEQLPDVNGEGRSLDSN